MKRILLFLLIMIQVLIFSFCAKVDESDRANVGTLTLPIASFSYSGNDGPSPVTIQFTNTSEYADSFEWDFGDGSKSTEINPSHTFINNTGETKSFLVRLTATDLNTGEKNTRSKSIPVQSSK